MKRIRLASCLLILASLSVHAGERGCHVGSVYEDRDGDGRRGGDEPGLPGIAVSNGRDIVRSDARGDYRLPARPGAEVFVIKPAGSTVARREDGLPDHWRAGADCRPFGVRRAPASSGDLQVLLFGDPQPKSPRDIDYYRRDIVEPLIGKTRARLGMSMGDIVDDDLSLYPALNAATARLGLPWLHAPGNHDLDVGADDAGSLATFRSHFGPDTFAWEEAEANFIVLDDVVWQPASTPKYIGGFREDQFVFLENYLRQAPRNRLLVLALHIPLFEAPGRDTFRDEDRARLFALLRDFPRVLIVSAHTHTQRHVFHGMDTGWHGVMPLHEYNIGAVCGAFWSGVEDAAGIPAATMADGTPNGWAMLTVELGGEYTLAWHPARDAADTGIGLYAPRVLRRGAYPAWAVYANVWMGMDDTRVEYRIDGGAWKPMRKVSQPDPAMLAENVRDDEAAALRGYDRSPEATPSPHLWRGALPTDLATGEHDVEVRALDRWHGWRQARTRYRLRDAEP
ncbi:calcineurin phosphoesterase [Lysobacter pythonis]|uniref:Calcineurin phosphoesterase n=1 Tax=Solilutibacter pythonis TaxID=2483112 RepID=A0A3M2HSW5_9GAMM|nr:calcineurin-like phosphoesterase C-terminal domain-containing protein [Lysobacter pythonis]RMH90760.1 calcineurin phosphoesterase [Lysobacter pythonis]